MPNAEQSSGFGAVLRECRLAAGLTQEALAERAGLGRRSIQGLEQGENAPRPETVRRLARALGLSSEQRSQLEAFAHPLPRRRRDASVSTARGRARETRALRCPLGNLPIPLTSFIGRDADLATVRSLLRDPPSGARLLTLTGTGGCGKTRLALRVAANTAAAYSDGVWLVELGALGDPALVPQTVARALGLAEDPTQPVLAALVRHLGDRQILLVLDNCEHLILACAELVTALLAACPRLRILATSREALRIAGEVTWRVPSLTTPDLDHPPPAPIRSPVCSAVTRSAFSSSGRGRCSRASRSPPPTRATWPGSAPGSTGCPWRSSSPPRGSPR